MDSVDFPTISPRSDTSATFGPEVPRSMASAYVEDPTARTILVGARVDVFVVRGASVGSAIYSTIFLSQSGDASVGSVWRHEGCRDPRA